MNQQTDTIIVKSPKAGSTEMKQDLDIVSMILLKYSKQTPFNINVLQLRNGVGRDIAEDKNRIHIHEIMDAMWDASA